MISQAIQDNSIKIEGGDQLTSSKHEDCQSEGSGGEHLDKHAASAAGVPAETALDVEGAWGEGVDEGRGDDTTEHLGDGGD